MFHAFCETISGVQKHHRNALKMPYFSIYYAGNALFLPYFPEPVQFAGRLERCFIHIFSAFLQNVARAGVKDARTYALCA